jgi:hypothetical protein
VPRSASSKKSARVEKWVPKYRDSRDAWIIPVAEKRIPGST